MVELLFLCVYPFIYINIDFNQLQPPVANPILAVEMS